MRLQAFFDLFGQVLLDESERSRRVVIHIDSQQFLDFRDLQFDIHFLEIHSQQPAF
jgi:hypothetical protein